MGSNVCLSATGHIIIIDAYLFVCWIRVSGRIMNLKCNTQKTKFIKQFWTSILYYLLNPLIAFVSPLILYISFSNFFLCQVVLCWAKLFTSDITSRKVEKLVLEKLPWFLFPNKFCRLMHLKTTIILILKLRRHIIYPASSRVCNEFIIIIFSWPRFKSSVGQKMT